MQAVIEMDILEYDVNNNLTTTKKHSGTSTLIYQIGFSIVRLVPVQNIYTGTNKNYTGLSSSSDIMITLGSSFTLEYQTRYIPSAFPNIDMATMKWGISLRGYSYYMDSTLGNYMTLDDEGRCISISPTLTLDPNEQGKILVTKNASGDYQYVHDGRTITLELHNKTNTTLLPKGTKITLVDLSGLTPTYYYYIYQGTEKEINFDDFCLMGTETKIKDSGLVPTYKQLYNTQEASRVTERLILMFDLGQVSKEYYTNLIDNVYDGSIILQHNYNGIDIMDYVKSETLNDITTYSRSAPKVGNYSVNVEATGIKNFDVEFVEDSYKENVNAQLEIVVEEDSAFENTQLSNGSIGIKIETNDGTDLPDGIEFVFEGSYLPKYGNKYLIIPVKNYGSYVVDLINELGTIETSEGHAIYKATLCYLPDDQYFNETIVLNTEISKSNVECVITEELQTSLDVQVENRYIVIENTNSINIKTYLKNAESNEIDFKAYLKTQDGLIETNSIYSRTKITGSETGTNVILYINDQIEKGTYQLCFTNSDKVVIINIIIN